MEGGGGGGWGLTTYKCKTIIHYLDDIHNDQACGQGRVSSYGRIPPFEIAVIKLVFVYLVLPIDSVH